LIHVSSRLAHASITFESFRPNRRAIYASGD
jgi:hypothetical protein